MGALTDRTTHKEQPGFRIHLSPPLAMPQTNRMLHMPGGAETLSMAIHRLLTAACVAACAGAAHAEDFTFTYSSDLAVAHGVLSGIANGDGSYSILSGVLSVDSGSTVGTYDLIANPNGTSTFYSATGFFIVNNQLNPANAAALDYYGLLFAANGREVNLYRNGQTDTFYSHGGGDMSVNGDFRVSMIPAPTVLTIMGLGSIYLGRRRR